MRTLLFSRHIFVIIVLGLFASCAKKDAQGPAVGFTRFAFKATNNQGLVTDVVGVINNDNIVVKLPAAADITQLVPAYDFDNPETIVYVNKMPQENGVSVVDFSQPVEYQLRGRASRRTYTVTVVKTASFTKFGFVHEKNDGVLFKDFTGTIAGLNVTVLVPVGTDLKKLRPDFETTPGATVKVNGTIEQSGTVFHDFTTPVKFELTDADTPTPAVFTVAVGFLTAPVWQKVNNESWPMETAVSGSARLAIHPVTNLPYIVFQLSKDATGTSLATADKKVVVIRNTGTAWEYVGGAAGFSDGDARDPVIAFDKTGVMYVAYRDYADVSANQQKVTVKKYEGSAWTTVGSSRFTPTKADYMSLGVDGSNKPWISLAKQETTSDPLGYEKRQLYTMKFDNNAWNVVAMTSKYLAAGTKLVTANDKFYMGIIDRTAGTQRLSAFEMLNNQWTAVGPTSFLNENKVASINITMAVGPDGTKYMAYQNASVSNSKAEYVMMYNGATWDRIGDEVNVKTASDIFALAVHPNGTLYFASLEPGLLSVRTFNKQTNNWNTAVTTLVNEAVSGVDMLVSNDGIPYVAVTLSSTNKIEVYKLDLPK